MVLANVSVAMFVEALAGVLLLRRILRLGKTLNPKYRTLVAVGFNLPHAVNIHDCLQQHPPLRVANPPRHTAIGQSLSKLI